MGADAQAQEEVAWTWARIQADRKSLERNTRPGPPQAEQEEWMQVPAEVSPGTTLQDGSPWCWSTSWRFAHTTTSTSWHVYEPMGKRSDGGLQKGSTGYDQSSTDTTRQGEDRGEERAWAAPRAFFNAYITEEPFTDFTAEPYTILETEPYAHYRWIWSWPNGWNSRIWWRRWRLCRCSSRRTWSWSRRRRMVVCWRLATLEEGAEEMVGRWWHFERRRSTLGWAASRGDASPTRWSTWMATSSSRQPQQQSSTFSTSFSGQLFEVLRPGDCTAWPRRRTTCCWSWTRSTTWKEALFLGWRRWQLGHGRHQHGRAGRERRDPLGWQSIALRRLWPWSQLQHCRDLRGWRDLLDLGGGRMAWLCAWWMWLLDGNWWLWGLLDLWGPLSRPLSWGDQGTGRSLHGLREQSSDLLAKPTAATCQRHQPWILPSLDDEGGWP